MSGVEFNGKVGGINNSTPLTNVGHISNSFKIGLMGYGHAGNAGGASLERNIEGLNDVMKHFENISLMVYSNKDQGNLNLPEGATLIPDYGPEPAEV